VRQPPRRADVYKGSRTPAEQTLDRGLSRLISETNGVSLGDTLELAAQSMLFRERPVAQASVIDFRSKLFDYGAGRETIETLLEHEVASTLGGILVRFPKPFREEHIHLTGSLTADFVYPRLMALLDGPNGPAIENKIRQVYGEGALPITSEADVDRLIRLRGAVSFQRYLHMLTLPKLVLVDREAHEAAAYHMASDLFHSFNVGMIRLKFSITRLTSDDVETLPGEAVSAEDVVLGLYEGFARFGREQPQFDFVLSPCFRKEAAFYDAKRFDNKQDFFFHYVEEIVRLTKKYPFLVDKLTDVDTVGDERDHYRKVHFDEMRLGLRKLQFRGMRIRSHHGETWKTLKRGVQAVDNAMNIWHIDTLEHGVSLGVNPNHYFHLVFERAMAFNTEGRPVPHPEQAEVIAMDWRNHPEVRDKLVRGVRLDDDDIRRFIKTKFHTAREVEHYQHDVLNRMIDKGVSLVALPSSNIMLTRHFPTHKDHPFSWWEKKGVQLGVGTDNYVTLNTNFIREMLILLCTDVDNLKITKLLMVVTGESRRPYMSRLLWSLRV
jgi:adenosine deaminase